MALGKAPALRRFASRRKLRENSTSFFVPTTYLKSHGLERRLLTGFVSTDIVRTFCQILQSCYYCSMLKIGRNRLTPRSKKTAVQKLDDLQSQRDDRELRIDKVGVRGLRFPIQVRDKAHSIQNTVATIGMFVDLPKEFKGTHMSRFVEALNEHGSIIHVENIRDILHSLQKRLNSATSHLEMEFPYFMSKKSPVSHKESLMYYTARFDAAACGTDIDFVLTVKAHVTTLCPCSKAIARYGAHNQRGLVTVALRSAKAVWIEDVVAMIESSASSELYALLKRQDEKFVTERAYENPVFVEDLVRNVALKLNADARVTWYKVEAENFESIHNHNAYACIEKG